jgi:hypothetical protein
MPDEQTIHCGARSVVWPAPTGVSEDLCTHERNASSGCWSAAQGPRLWRG